MSISNLLIHLSSLQDFAVKNEAARSISVCVFWWMYDSFLLVNGLGMQWFGHRRNRFTSRRSVK